MIASIGSGLKALANIVQMTGQIQKALDHDNDHDSIGINQRHTQAIMESLEELIRLSTELNLDSTEHFSKYCIELFSRGQVVGDGSLIIEKNNAERVVQCLDSLKISFLVQMQNKLVLIFGSRHAHYLYDDAPAFGVEVDDAFPTAAAEISEAAKCLAFQRPTATVFHLMRAMELAVQKLAERLGIPKIEKEWGKLLSDISKEIESMPKGSARNAWSSIHVHLYHVKQAWRNDTMHPKTTYTENEAENVFEAVKIFMIALIPVILLDT